MASQQQEAHRSSSVETAMETSVETAMETAMETSVETAVVDALLDARVRLSGVPDSEIVVVVHELAARRRVLDA
ncbi:MAG: hypothetical protein ACTIA6_11700, partial [Pseudoclavibacter sp.]